MPIPRNGYLEVAAMAREGALAFTVYVLSGTVEVFEIPEGDEGSQALHKGLE